ncbi:Hsp20/alpha crystallin family protein [Curtobacterium flaccumfaciens]|uniref:Hsp20/alpha crystallin family protein n=1 Tax=Curtobacterium flaccumfaciens TaxID=2035 RepID=UPI001E3C9111|nr:MULTISPECIES: Hsp20/alpha crystallin family protein [Curtobacterium]MCE0456354.1 Hsp20/alpha crystallin family protein [Curtobacterium allii]MCS5521338.1 Hsp20/alpha crystallin family protein [Curtobacterium flaccumfaciens pv. oortii]
MTMNFDPFRELDRLAGSLLGTSAGPRSMPMDLYRTGDHYVLDVDLPGIDPGSVDIDVDGSVLTIRAERTLGAPEGSQWLTRERQPGTFVRQLTLGDGLDAERITAGYDNGVLSVTIPVKESAKPRKIAVTVGGASEQLAVGSGTAVE